MKSETVRCAFRNARERVYNRREIRTPDDVSEVSGGWCVVLGRDDTPEHDLIFLADKSRKQSNGETRTAEQAQMFDTCADAMAASVAVMRESLGEYDMMDYPATEFPRVAYVRLSASVWLGSNS